MKSARLSLILIVAALACSILMVLSCADECDDDENSDDDDTGDDVDDDDVDDDDVDDDDSGDDDDQPDGIDWVSIPAGAYQMGCSPGDLQCDGAERPRHSVSISAFQMTATEITQAQYLEVMGDNPSFNSECGDCPVEQVPWEDAGSFCEQINGRLPTEAEWEYAARAGTTTKFYCGDNSSCLDDIAWFNENSGGVTHPVGGKTPNSWGLYDVSGNVWEWTADWYNEDYYSDSPAEDPPGPATGLYRVVRGGGWYGSPEFLRISYRGFYDLGDRFQRIGFRCAKD